MGVVLYSCEGGLAPGVGEVVYVTVVGMAMPWERMGLGTAAESKGGVVESGKLV